MKEIGILEWCLYFMLASIVFMAIVIKILRVALKDKGKKVLVLFFVRETIKPILFFLFIKRKLIEI